MARQKTKKTASFTGAGPAENRNHAERTSSQHNLTTGVSGCALQVQQSAEDTNAARQKRKLDETVSETLNSQENIDDNVAPVEEESAQSKIAGSMSATKQPGKRRKSAASSERQQRGSHPLHGQIISNTYLGPTGP
jgi:DEAD/DEAH box helicase domain-containing protein